MRIFFTLAIVCGCTVAQVIPPPEPIPVDVPPLQPVDLATLYASPRDAARHRLQTTISDLQSKRDIRAALRGFADAFLTDVSYSTAAFDLGIIAAIAEKWDDAIAAFGEAARLNPKTFGAQAQPQLVRLRLIAQLEKTEEGKRRRRYDDALLPLLTRLPKLPEAEAMAGLAEVGRIDPGRWESPAPLAGLNGNGHGYDIAAKFLAIALTNASDATLKLALQNAQNSVEREMRYAAARAAAEVAADEGDHAKASELFEAAWTTIPARASNGLSAASELLLQDDTAHASALLARLETSSDPDLKAPAAAMLKHLQSIEPAAGAPHSDMAEFFRDSGPTEPIRIATLLPPIDRKEMDLLARPLPKIVQDTEPVVLLAALSADSTEALQGTLPGIPDPVATLENGWREALAARRRPAPPPAQIEPAHDLQTVDLAPEIKTAHLLKLTSEPAGARVVVDNRTDPSCQTPCDLRLEGIPHAFRFNLAGYKDEERALTLEGKVTELVVPLFLIRGTVIVETSGSATLKVNGVPVNVSAPAELALLPGLHSISADFGSASQERVVQVKPGSRLRIHLNPAQ